MQCEADDLRQADHAILVERLHAGRRDDRISYRQWNATQSVEFTTTGYAVWNRTKSVTFVFDLLPAIVTDRTRTEVEGHAVSEANTAQRLEGTAWGTHIRSP